MRGKARIPALGASGTRWLVPVTGMALAGALTYFLLLAGTAGAVSTTLFPNSDKSNIGALWTNNSGNACNGIISALCSSRIDEDIDTPDDTDFAQSANDPVASIVEFELLDAPNDLGSLSSLDVRYRAHKTGSKAASVKVDVLNSSNTLVGSGPLQALTNSATTYSYTISSLSLTQADVDGLYLRFTATASGVGTATRVLMTAVNLETNHVTVTPNPEIAPTCGTDMVLVIDSSGSIDGTELQQMKDAYEDFVDAFLPFTPTEIAVVDFDTDATVIQNFTTNVPALNTAINSVTSGGTTNWQDGLLDARNLFPNRTDKPDLIVFASDGNPNTIGSNGSTSLVSESVALQAAITQANMAKSAGIRIEALGIGTDPNVSNLEAISSEDAVTVTNFANLADDLADLAKELCGGTITAHKIIDQDGDINTTGDQMFQSGWTFNANVTSAGDSSTPPSGPTDVNGFILFDIDLGGDDMATVNIVETVQPGYGVIYAECHAYQNGPLGTWNNGNAVNGITLGAADITICNFYNSIQDTFVVNKDFQPNAGGSVNVSLSCASGIDAPATAPASEATPATFTVTGYTGDPMCTATESPIPGGYESTGTCSASLSTGVCTITNVLRTGNINVLKDFTDNNPANVNVVGGCTSGTLIALDSSASEADAANFQLLGFSLGATCTFTETVPFGYVANQAACSGVTVMHGGTSACTITNTPTQATLTVYKDFDPDNNVIIVMISVSCTSGTVSPLSAPASEGSPAVFTITTFGPGTTCTATETAPPGYSGDASACQMVAISNGNNSQCTITNTAIVQDFEVQKDFSDNNPMSVMVSLSCASGTVSPSSTLMSESSPATFTVIAPAGDPNCTATEVIPGGYTSSGTCSAPLVSVGTCTITNTYNPLANAVPFYVYKDFTDNNVMDVLVSLNCAPGTVLVNDDTSASEADPANFTVENLPGTTCTASEAVPPGYVANYSDCINVPVGDLSCTIVNTPGTPSVGGEVEMLTFGATGGAGGRTPLALLALLPVLGAVFVGARRLYRP